MGYDEVDGAWKHPTRQAVFVGDFIDRGPEQRRAVAIPQAVVEMSSMSTLPLPEVLSALNWSDALDLLRQPVCR